MTDEVKISFTFNGQTYHGAHQEHLKHRQKLWIYIRSVLCILMVGFGGYLMTATTQRDFGYIFVAAGSIGFLRPMIWQMWHERLARKNPAYGSKIHYTFSQKGISISGNQGKYTIQWSDLHELVFTKKGLLIYQTKKSYLWIPNSVLGKNREQIERFV